MVNVWKDENMFTVTIKEIASKLAFNLQQPTTFTYIFMMDHLIKMGDICTDIKNVDERKFYSNYLKIGFSLNGPDSKLKLFFVICKQSFCVNYIKNNMVSSRITDLANYVENQLSESNWSVLALNLTSTRSS